MGSPTTLRQASPGAQFLQPHGSPTLQRLSSAGSDSLGTPQASHLALAHGQPTAPGVTRSVPLGSQLPAWLNGNYQALTSSGGGLKSRAQPASFVPVSPNFLASSAYQQDAHGLAITGASVLASTAGSPPHGPHFAGNMHNGFGTDLGPCSGMHMEQSCISSMLT